MKDTTIIIPLLISAVVCLTIIASSVYVPELQASNKLRNAFYGYPEEDPIQQPRVTQLKTSPPSPVDTYRAAHSALREANSEKYWSYFSDELECWYSDKNKPLQELEGARNITYNDILIIGQLNLDNKSVVLHDFIYSNKNKKCYEKYSKMIKAQSGWKITAESTERIPGCMYDQIKSMKNARQSAKRIPRNYKKNWYVVFIETEDKQIADCVNEAFLNGFRSRVLVPIKSSSKDSYKLVIGPYTKENALRVRKALGVWIGSDSADLPLDIIELGTTSR